MTELTLAATQTLIAAALDHTGKAGLKPLAVAVLDSRGAMKGFAAQEGTSLKRGDVAHGTAHGALALGMGSRATFKRAQQPDYFIAPVSHVVGGAHVPVPGNGRAPGKEREWTYEDIPGVAVPTKKKKT